MYIRVSKVNRMIAIHDLDKIFTFSNSIYKSIGCTSDTKIYFYRTLGDMIMAEKLNKEELIDGLTVELVPVTLEGFSVSKSLRRSHCVCIISNGVISLGAVGEFFKSSVCCYFELEKSEKVFYLVEFKEEIEVTDYDEKPTFSLEDYVDHLIGHHLYK